MFGRSLSFCVRDILDGKVNIEEVEKIYTSTMAESEDDMTKLIRIYSVDYWSKHSQFEILSVMQKLIRENKIVQPRITDGISYIWLGDKKGHWVDSVDDVKSAYFYG